MDCSLPGSSIHGFSRQEYWKGCHFFLKRIFWTQERSPLLLCLLHWQAGSLPLAPPGKPHAPHVSGAKSCFLFHLEEWQMPASWIPPAPQQSPWGWQHLLDHNLGSPHLHLEARNHWKWFLKVAVIILIYWYGRSYFHFTKIISILRLVSQLVSNLVIRVIPHNIHSFTHTQRVGDIQGHGSWVLV